mgnify:CR=1 FL=1
MGKEDDNVNVTTLLAATSTASAGTGKTACKVERRVILVDGLIMYAICAVIVATAYMVLGGTFPLNAYIASLFCNMTLGCLGGKQ